jgi:hypothetical protein
MPKCTITLTDDGESINAAIESYPAFPGPAAKDQALSPAQSYALYLFEKLHEAISENQMDSPAP